MIPAKIQSALWSRPRSRVEWGFCLVLLAMMGAGAAWLASHSGAEEWGALRNWFATMEGDTSLKLRTADFVRGGLMLSAISWISIGAILWLTRHWWLFSRSQDHRGKTRPDRQFFLGLALILILATAIRLPRLNLSLYNDEVDVFRTAIAGSFDGKVLDDPTNLAPAGFREVTWTETVWGNRIGNNHVLHSILARAGYDAWRKVSGAPPGTIREWPLRFPVLLGGLLSIALIALIARQIASAGLPNHHLGSRLGLIAAFLLSIHPWHVRYSTEARGYGLVFGFAALAFFFLLLAMERRRWRYWLAFGASQALCLWACLGSLHLIVGLNLVTGLTLIWPARRPDSTRLNPLQSPHLQGWIVANALSAAVFILAAAPILPPIEMALQLNATFRKGIAPHWWFDVGSYLLVGMPWLDGDPENVRNPAVTKYLGDPFVWTALILAATSSLFGMVRLWRLGNFPGRLLVAAPIIGIALPWIDSEFSGVVLLKWYVNYGTIFIALWMAAGFQGWMLALSDLLTPTRLRLMAYSLLGLYALGVTRPLNLYRHQSKQSLKEAIELARGGTFPFTENQENPLVAGWWTHANYYDPFFKICYTPEKLEIMVQRAKSEHRPLYFILGMRDAAQAEDARVIDRLEKSGEFETLSVLPGLEERQFRTYVYRLKAPPTS